MTSDIFRVSDTTLYVATHRKGFVPSFNLTRTMPTVAHDCDEESAAWLDVIKLASNNKVGLRTLSPDGMPKVQIHIETSALASLTRWHIQRVLRWIPKHDLDGLALIRVIDECPDDELEARRVPAYMWGFLYNGQYLKARKNRPAQIQLFANDVCFGVPKVFLVSPVATLKIARTLAHEIGHHVIATRGYIYQPSEKYRPWNGIRNPEEETMADRYASDITERMLRHPSYKLGKSLTRMLSSLLYSAGLRNYWKQNYQLAASMLARAHSLNLENEDAGQAYRHAMEKLKTQSPSKLNAAEKEWLTNRYSSKPLTATRKPYFTSKR